MIGARMQVRTRRLRPEWLRRHKLPLAGLLALLLLIFANYWLNRQELTVWAALALIGGLAVWTALIRSGRGLVPDDDSALAADPPLRRSHWILLATLIPLLTIAWIQSAGNTFRPVGTACWLVATGVWLAAWWPRAAVHPKARTVNHPVGADDPPVAPVNQVVPMPGLERPGSRTVIASHREVLAVVLLAVLLLAAFYRFYNLDQTPLDPTSDHAEKLYDVSDVLDGKRPIFFERNTGREPAQFYFTAGLVETLDLPLSFQTLKFGTAIIGLATLPFVYLLAAELMGRLAGLLAATLYAMSNWTVATSRAGLRFPYAPMLTAATFWLLLRWMRSGDRRDALLCGIAIGIGLYGYTPFRVVAAAVALGIFLTSFMPSWRGESRRIARHGLLIASTAAVVFLPLGRYSFDRPDMFWYRTTSSIGGEGSKGAIEAALGNLSVFLRNNINAALAFNWKGDGGFINAVTDDPFLDVVSGGLFLAGIVTIIVAIIRRRDRRLLFLVLALPVLLLASTLVIETPWENPSVNRSGATAPIIFAVTALPLALLMQWMVASFGRVWGWRSAALVSVVMLSVAGILNYDRYFHDFDRQTRSIVAPTSAIADAILSARVIGVTPADAYIIDIPYWLDIRNVAIALGDVTWAAEHNVTVDAPLPERRPDRPLFLVVDQGDAARLAEIEQTYPDGVLTRVETGVTAKDFFTYWVPPAIQPS